MYRSKVIRTDLMLAILLSAAISLAPAQVPQASGPIPRFEISSIKPSRPDAAMADMRITFPKGRMEAVNITIRDLLLALSGFSGKVEGGPKWLDSDRYDISARADREFAGAERGPMIMALLEERFKLQVHTDLHEENGINLATNGKQLNLIVAKDDEANSIGLADRRVVFTHVTMTDLNQLSSFVLASAGGEFFGYVRRIRFCSYS